jgi:hypothetical protein
MLRALADEGLPGHGLRGMIAHHVIFHWNRGGLLAPAQASLALATQKVVFATRLP